MKLLVLDGNSIANRAFYGIKLLTNKKGNYTNAIYGFLKILQKLCDSCSPDACAVAFDVHAPTFRHEMYEHYKEGRHAMPEELREQMPVLKNLLNLLGYKTVECAGWEADDILGTLAEECRKQGCECYISTGDRDSLQLAHGGVRVYLARTLHGQAETALYDENRILEEYGVTSRELIQVKAIQGDTSDKIPGVPGIGEKGALALISKYHSVDYIYENIDSIDVKEGIRNKLKNGKESAYLSLKLGTISTDVPIDRNLSSYKIECKNKQEAAKELARLELYSLMDKFNLSASDFHEEAEEEKEERNLERLTCLLADDLLERLKKQKRSYCLARLETGAADALYFADGDTVFVMPSDAQEFSYFVRTLFGSEEIELYSYNTKLLHRLAAQMEIECKCVKGDLMLSAYLLNPSDSNYSIERLCADFNVPMPTYADSLGNGDEYVEKCAVLKQLFEKTDVLLDEAEQRSLLESIELPLSAVLARMEITGVAVDKNGIEDFGKMLEEKINLLMQEIYELAGEEFNINSPKQLGTVLFERLNLPAKKKTKSGYSTNAEVLESLVNAHPIVSLVLEYRSLAKLKSTYCDGLLKVIADDGRIHTSFNQVETRTGRISSLEPNLQNIPVRTELGREMRRFFVAGKDCVLADADYSQIELRVLADLSGDENMINAFNNNDDIHTITASQVFNLPCEMVTPQMRSRAKAVNFGIVYGIGAYSLAKDIGVSNKEAKQYIDNYLATYHGVADYMNKMIDSAKELGYAKTLFNRRRYLPELNSSNHMMRAFGERVARNMPIQGTAADIIKIAMIKVDSRLRSEKLSARLILQVHDELIVEAPENEEEQVINILKEEMENACRMKVKLTADAKSGKSWYDTH